MANRREPKIVAGDARVAGEDAERGDRVGGRVERHRRQRRLHLRVIRVGVPGRLGFLTAGPDLLQRLFADRHGEMGGVGAERLLAGPGSST